jgi:hypothetical protein
MAAGHAEHLAQRGHLRFAAARAPAFRDVEDEVGRVRKQGVDQRAPATKRPWTMAETPERVGEAVDRRHGVVFLERVDGRVGRQRKRRAQFECDADVERSHGRCRGMRTLRG